MKDSVINILTLSPQSPSYPTAKSEPSTNSKSSFLWGINKAPFKTLDLIMLPPINFEITLIKLAPWYIMFNFS